LAKEDKDAADAPTVSPKKKHAKKARQERRDDADGQNRSKKEEHADKQEDTRTEATAASENKKTENVPEGGTGVCPGIDPLLYEPCPTTWCPDHTVV
jgi:hypothetical protein